jgi:hypothetical protein
MPPGGGVEMRIQRPSRTGAGMAAMVLAAFLPACGGGGGGGNTPTTLPPAPQPVRTQLLAANFTVAGVPEANRAGFQTDVAAGVTVTVTGSGTGTIQIDADWTFASNDIDILWFSAPCTSAQAVRGQCTVVARTTSITQKPERLTITNVGAGTYGVGFQNFGATTESGNFQIYFTR